MKTIARIFLWLIVLIAVVAGGLFAAHQVTPWPSAMLIRYAFEAGAAKTSRALEKHVPKDVASLLNERYDEADAGALLDVHFPAAVDNTAQALPTVVWIHGGGFLSGSKGEIANYAKILASKGFTVVGVDYSLAPAKTYPTPVRQVNVALGYLVKNARRLHVNANKFVLAGDSAGAHIAAQLANAISVPDYAKALGIEPAIDRLRLSGAMLYCGPYDLASIGRRPGAPGMLAQTMGWSYFGTKDYANEERFATFSVAKHLTPERDGPGFRDSLAAWLRWILGLITPPIFLAPCRYHRPRRASCRR
ncbi:MAG: alpha/beta hydrolase, partial [Alphaproteobacteria bacterium]|nr:alpha/beta hydrolase [Alphaproteobacteria bacterium]